jgi:hypothetical protein
MFQLLDATEILCRAGGDRSTVRCRRSIWLRSVALGHTYHAVAPASTRASTAASWLLARAAARGVQPVLLERLRSAPACRSTRVASTGQRSCFMPARQLSNPVSRPRRSGGREESASHMTVERCACARTMDSSRGGRAERRCYCKPQAVAVFNTLSRCCFSVAGTTVHPWCGPTEQPAPYIAHQRRP